MIHIFIGTKAQYIKTAPVIKELEKRGIGYNLIDSGQHAELQEKFRNFLEIRKPDILMREGSGDITNPFVLVKWLTDELFKTAFFPSAVNERLFKNEGGVCLVHGDTPTTLLSAIIAKRCGLKIAHLEAGLRSYNIFNPFPEEFIRILVMRMSDMLFVSSDWAYDNLKNMGVKGKIVFVHANTGLDAVRYSMAKYVASEVPMKDYCMVSIHRFERLVFKNRLKEIIDLTEKISLDKKVIFPLHPPTRAFLKRFGLLNRLLNMNNVLCSELYEHGHFLHLLKNADFVVTDGGSIQEESYYFGVPCIVLRRHTERQEGLGRNAVLAGKDKKIADEFLKNYHSFRGNDITGVKFSPSAEIVDFLMSIPAKSER